jgi:hypothetical protein
VDLDIVYTDHTKPRSAALEKIATELDVAKKQLAGQNIESDLIRTKERRIS